MCEPSQCSGYFSDLKSYIGMKIFTFLWDLTLTHEWAQNFLSKLLKDHNKGENESDLLEIKRNYEKLAKKHEFVKLKGTVPEQLATWDDHDYCRNDAGSSCQIKEKLKDQFLSFWRGDHYDRGDREGVYESYNYTIPNEVTKSGDFSIQVSSFLRLISCSALWYQVIVLDTRYFRTPLIYRDDVLAEDGTLLKELRTTCGDHEDEGAPV